MGHSYGGAAVIFSNEKDYGQNVVIDISGGELSWGEGNPYWEIDLREAMKNQQRPIYFLQPKNGRTLEPMEDLFGIAITKLPVTSNDLSAGDMGPGEGLQTETKLLGRR
jgi:hypothetical protein